MSVRVGQLTGVYKNMMADVVALVFRCCPDSLETKSTEESAEVRWMTLQEVCEAMNPVYSVRVTDAFSIVTSVRAHDGIRILDGASLGSD